MDDQLTALGVDEAFRFACGPEVACFNDCCRDLNQALTPYDVLRLKRGLGLPSGCFLARFTRRHTGPGSGLPVVSLAPADPQTRACPFVSAAGCRVYPDRPASCRTYPLVRAVRRSQETGAAVPSYFILTEPHCRGFAGNRTQTARQWVADQGIGDYNAENDRMLDVIRLKNRLRRGPLHRHRPNVFTPPSTTWTHSAVGSSTTAWRPSRRWAKIGWRPPATTTSRCCGWGWNG